MNVVSSTTFRFTHMSTRLCLAIALAMIPIFVQADDPKWQVVWQDDFSGDKLDYSKWEVEINAFGGGNHELQIYTDRHKNVRVENGNLVIEAHRDNAEISGTKREYSSARIRSKHRGDWKYGKFEIRAKLPAGQGLWPAIWMLPTEDTYGTWAASGEIDIMEFKGQEPHQVWGTLHYGQQWPNNKHSSSQYQLKSGGFDQDFHLFTLEWEEGKMRWLVDGIEYQEQHEWNSSGGKFPAPFDQPFHMVLNMAVGGGFLGNPDDKTPFPSQFLVDFVRVSQKR